MINDKACLRRIPERNEQRDDGNEKEEINLEREQNERDLAIIP